MGTELQVYQKVTDVQQFVELMAKPIAALCGCSTEVGAAMALTIMCENLNPLQAQQKYHFIKGTPSMKAEAMLTEFRTKHGGDHEVIECSPTRAAIMLTKKGGKPQEFEFTIEKAMASRWPWKDWTNHEKGLKDNWATPEDQENMLWARLVSKSLKRVCPEATNGLYTPEEIMDIPADDAHRTRVLSTEEALKKAQETAASKVTTPVVEPAPELEAEDVGVVDAEFVEVPSEQNPTSGLANRVSALFHDLGIDPAKSLEKRGVASLAELSEESLRELLAKLEAEEKNRAAVKN